MPGPSLLQYNTYYHIFNRCNNRENLFREERNYAHFLSLYTYHTVSVADTFAYCLLPNHFHLLVRIKTFEEIHKKVPKSAKISKCVSPSQRFSNLFNAYTKDINSMYKRTGSLFEHPFRRIPVTSESYFVRLVSYIHQNPQHHNLIDDFRNWPYSSYQPLLSDKPIPLARDRVIQWFGGAEQIAQLHQQTVDETELSPWMIDL